MSVHINSDGWGVTTLDDIVSDISYGYTAKSDNEQVGPKLLRITDIQDNKVDWNRVPYCKIPQEKKIKYLLRRGDLVFARTGATVGKSFLIKEEIPDCIYASYLIRVRCLLRENIDYLSYFFNTPDYWSQITDFSAGIGQPNVNGTKLKKLIVPIPPLAEQREIADRLDTLLAQVDTLKGRLDALPGILKRFRQSVLAAAMSGSLIGKSSLSSSPLIEFVNIHNGARRPISSTKRKDIQGNIPYYGATGIVDHLNGHTHAGRYLLVGEDGANLLSKSKDLAFIITGKSWINNHAHVLQEKEGVSLDFIRLSINSLDLSPWVTGSAQPKLTKKSLVKLPIPKLDLKEQTEIVRKVEQLFAFADQVEQRVKEAQGRVNNLTQSILAKAFRGELTAEWREQHPELISGENSASTLLARIQAERAAQAPVKRTRKKKASA
ncbi:restriction endonuclease subunit S [Cobetia marina]|uniref:restriction endonuclease subunit S n=1 Tax=Cobetia marina TaxID=28258 RepID=UPI0009FBF0B8|nr:restriction endonuclease subunit S [Cobetia marina]